MAFTEYKKKYYESNLLRPTQLKMNQIQVSTTLIQTLNLFLLFSAGRKQAKTHTKKKKINVTKLKRKYYAYNNVRHCQNKF